MSEKLKEAGINFYMPERKMLRTWHDRKKYIDIPLFQSYVFVFLNNINEYYTGLACQGALQYVRFGKEVARISEKVIDDIRLVVDYAEDIEVSSDYLQPGSKLFIKDGPLTGLACEVVQSAQRKKILVRISLLQRYLLISIPFDFLIALPV